MSRITRKKTKNKKLVYPDFFCLEEERNVCHVTETTTCHLCWTWPNVSPGERKEPIIRGVTGDRADCSENDSCNRQLLWASSNVGISQEASTIQILLAIMVYFKSSGSFAISVLPLVFLIKKRQWMFIIKYLENTCKYKEKIKMTKNNHS